MSTLKKSLTRIAEACACRNFFQVSRDLSGAGSQSRASHSTEGSRHLNRASAIPWVVFEFKRPEVMVD